MNRSLVSLFALTASLVLVGCASQPSAPAAPASVASTASAAASTPAAPAASAPAAELSDAAIAEKFKGTWTGEWTFTGYGSGKFVLIGTSSDGVNLKGEVQLYGTASGDLKMPITKAVVTKGQLKGATSEMEFTLKMKSENEVAGEWFIRGYSGDLKAKR